MNSSLHPLLAIASMVVLAVLDLAGSVAAKEAVLRRSPPLAVAGAGIYVLLFVVLLLALKYAELSLVTLGWIVLLQGAVVVVDRQRYHVHLSSLQLGAMAVALFALAVVVVSSDSSRGPTYGSMRVTWEQALRAHGPSGHDVSPDGACFGRHMRLRAAHGGVPAEWDVVHSEVQR